MKTANGVFTTERKKERTEKWDRQVENLAFCLQSAAELTDQLFPFNFFQSDVLLPSKEQICHRDIGIAGIDNI